MVYGAYCESGVHHTPCWVAGWQDQYLGQRKAVLFGAALLTFGHFLMAF